MRSQTRVAYNFDDIQRAGEDLIVTARNEADRIREDAQREAESLRDQARQEGLAQGRDEGLREADRLIREQAEARARQLVDEQLRTALPAVTMIAADLTRERDLWLAHWEKIGINLAITIAEKLVRGELARRPELQYGRIAELLQLVAGDPEVTIRLSAADLTRLGDPVKKITSGLLSPSTVSVVPDDRIGPGDCIVETSHGEIDARIETQLDRLVGELLGGNL